MRLGDLPSPPRLREPRVAGTQQPTAGVRHRAGVGAPRGQGARILAAARQDPAEGGARAALPNRDTKQNPAVARHAPCQQRAGCWFLAFIGARAGRPWPGHKLTCTALDGLVCTVTAPGSALAVLLTSIHPACTPGAQSDGIKRKNCKHAEGECIPLSQSGLRFGCACGCASSNSSPDESSAAPAWATQPQVFVTQLATGRATSKHQLGSHCQLKVESHIL